MLLTSRTMQVAIRGVIDYVATSVVSDPRQLAEVYLLHASPSNIPGNSRLQFAYEKPPDSSYMSAEEIEADLSALVAVFDDLGSMRSEFSQDPLLEGISLSGVDVMSGAVFNVAEARLTATIATTAESATSNDLKATLNDAEANSGSAVTIVVVVILLVVVAGLGFLYYRRRQHQGGVEFAGSTARVVVNEAYSASPTASTMSNQRHNALPSETEASPKSPAQAGGRRFVGGKKKANKSGREIPRGSANVQAVTQL